MSDSKTKESLAILLRALKLPGFARHHEEIAQQAEREGSTFGQFLHHLAELEVDERRQRRTERNLKQSELPLEKTLATLGIPPFDILRVDSEEGSAVYLLAADHDRVMGPTGLPERFKFAHERMKTRPE